MEFVCETSSAEGADAADFVRDVEGAAELWRRSPGGHQPLRPDDRLVILTHCLAPGGAERQWCYLAIGLKRLGYDVSVVATHDVSGAGSHYLPTLERHAIPFLVLDDEDRYEEDGHFAGCNLEMLTRALSRLKPKAVFAQLDVPNILGAVAAHAAGVPRIVLSFRNYNPSHFPYIYQEWMRPCYRAIASSPRVVFTGNSQAANLDYASWIGMAPSRVHVVPNAIDPSDHREPGEDQRRLLRASLGLEEGAPVLIGIFRLSDEKRPFDFLEVCRRVRAALPRLQVLIVGEGPQRSKLAEAIRTMQLEACVQLLGRRTDIEALLRVSNALLLTSAHEGMPNVVMEAQLAAVPVVASRTGGVADCVAEGTTALLVEPGDVAGFAAGCIRILSDAGMARAMGVLGAELMRRDFTIEKMCSGYLELLAQPDSDRGEMVATTHGASPVLLPPIRPLRQELRG